MRYDHYIDNELENEMKLSTRKTELGMEQITVSEEGFDRRALMTRFPGQRMWSVQGQDTVGSSFNIVFSNGKQTPAHYFNAD